MKKQTQSRSLEDTFVHLSSKSLKGSLTLERILKLLSGRGRYLLIVLLSLPFLLPIPLPGVSIPFGLAIAFIGFRSAFSKNMWFPKWILERKISVQTLKKVSKIGLWITRKIKGLIHPRMQGVCHTTLARIINGMVIALMGFFLFIPVPIPLINTIVALALLFLAIGLLEDDGLWVIIGYVDAAAVIVLFVIMGYMIDAAVK